MTRKEPRSFFSRNPRNLIAGFGSFVSLLFGSWILIFFFGQKISADDAARWTLWLTAIAIITATGFSVLQAQSEFQRRRSEEDKQLALKYQYLEQQIFKIISDLENHKKFWGHDGSYELLGRIVQIEADHKALLMILTSRGLDFKKD